jgi:tRNA pseudouridine55 synthase
VHDFGQALGVGAYMSGLRRTKIGTFNVEDAMHWEALEQEINTLLEG